jgi:hypothetical protein
MLSLPNSRLIRDLKQHMTPSKGPEEFDSVI